MQLFLVEWLKRAFHLLSYPLQFLFVIKIGRFAIVKILISSEYLFLFVVLGYQFLFSLIGRIDRIRSNLK